MTIIPNLLEKILVLDPGAIASVKGNDYDTLEWDPSNVNPVPTVAALQAVTNGQVDDKNRTEAIDIAKARLADDPVLATIVEGLIDLAVATTPLTRAQVLQNLLDDLETRI